MSIKIRVILLLGLLLLGFAATLVAVRWLERETQANLLETETANRTGAVRHWIEVQARELREVAIATAASKVTILGANEGAASFPTRLDTALFDHGIAGFWLISFDGVILQRGGVLTAPPLDLSRLSQLPKAATERSFFASVEDRLVEVGVARVERAGAPTDFVIVARIWDQAQLSKLSTLMEAPLEILPPHQTTALVAPHEALTVLFPLLDLHGDAVRLLRVDFPPASTVEREATQSRMFFLFGVLVLLAMALAIELWVLRPLRRIGESLATSNPDVVAPLSEEQSELGRVAQLVQVSFQQRARLEQEVVERRRTQAALEKRDEDLRRTIEDRARLGRDLHDGVIQSLYAAGMGLTGIRALLDPEQTEAAARLEQTRATLNETIHDVRNFIVGLEPEALKTQTFEQAVHALVDALQVVRPIRTHVSIDNSLAVRLTLAQRVHALQIAREALSNAIRHGEAQNVRITLQPEEHFAAFEVVDDGHGFDLNASGRGQGLANFAQRARELGAELAVTSSPGHGAAVKIVFSFLPT